MKLKSFRVQNYKSIDDSGVIPTDDVTCLVGKNESGKTALFEALAKLNSLGPLKSEFDLDDFPRRRLNEYKRIHEDSPATAVESRFVLSDAEKRRLDELFGEGSVSSREISIEKRYNNVRYFSVHTDEAKYVQHLVRTSRIPDEMKQRMARHRTFGELLNDVRLTVDPAQEVQDFHYTIEHWHDRPLVKRVIAELQIPRFFYFDEYALLPGSVSLNALRKAEIEGTDEDSLFTALSLIRRIGATPEEFLDLGNFEGLKASLEDASNRITDEIFQFWSQNRELEVEFSLQPIVNDHKVHTDTILHIRIRNRRHRVSVPFDKRSRGFVWFFSFLVAFSQYRDDPSEVILLLDEPGHSLHAQAQRDLMHFINNELSPHHQVLYSTHSPFMVDPARAASIRAVVENDKLGTVVENDPSRFDPEAAFPLRASMSFELAEGLFHGANTLLVNSPADMVYLTVMSQVLENKGKTGLDSRWTVVPVGGADRVATFVSMMGNEQRNLALMLSLDGNQRKNLEAFFVGRRTSKKNIVTPMDFVEVEGATIEDLFNEFSIIELVQAIYQEELGNHTITEDDVLGFEPVIERLGRYLTSLGAKKGLERYRVASALLRSPRLQEGVADEETMERFDNLFLTLNKLIKRA